MTSPNTQNLNSDPQNPSNPTNPQNQQNQSSNQSQFQTQQTLNTPNPAGGQSSNTDTNAQIFEALNQLGGELRSLRAENQMLQFQIQNRGTAGPVQQNVPNQQQDNFQVPGKDEFWENPGDATRRVVENLMQRSLQPIQTGINFFMNQQQYQNAKARMKSMQQFAALGAVEDLFDAIITQALNAGNALSDGLLLTSYHTAVGLGMQQGRFIAPQQNQQLNQQLNQQQGNYQSQPFVMGQQNGNLPQQQNQQPQNNVVTPPYLQTNSQNQNQQGQIKLRDLNENEETVRKQTRMSKAEFLFYGDELSEDLFKVVDPAGHERYIKAGRRK